jgi:serine/threonine protein phosphatase 1
MILDFLEEPERNGAMWLRNGALETLRSYGVDVTRLLGSETPQFGAVREALVACLPVSHLVLLQRMPNSCENDRYFFAHAGARPARRLDQQTDEDLLWIRQGFADRDEPFEKVVVHGHTVVEKPYFGEYRVNLDTGAYFSNRLTCLMLEGDERRLIDV